MTPLTGPLAQCLPMVWGNWSSIPGWDIPKTQYMVLDASLFNTQHYKVWIKSKWSNPGKRVVFSPTPQCSSYWKGSYRVAFDYCLTIMMELLNFLCLSDRYFVVGWWVVWVLWYIKLCWLFNAKPIFMYIVSSF